MNSAPEDTAPAHGDTDAVELDRELHELATGFALDELDDAGLQRLYDLLRSSESKRAARVTWQMLETTVDLRSQLNQRFQDTLRHKLGGRTAPERDRGFLDGLFQRIGRRRPGLTEVPRAESADARRWPLPLLVLPILAALIALSALLWWWFAASGVATVIERGGRVTSEGRVLARGAAIDRQVVAVAEGARLQLYFRQDHQLLVTGPATLLPGGPGSVSISSGHCAARSAEVPFTIGLPDRRLRLEPETRAVIEISGGRSHIAVATGRALLITDAGERALTSNQAISGSSKPFRWLREAQWHQERDEGNAGRTLVSDPAATRWRTAATLVLFDEADRIAIADGAGNRLELQPARLLIAAANENARIVDLSGPPLRERRIAFGIDGARILSLHIDGHTGPLPMPFTTPVLTFTAEGTARFDEVDHFTGVPPLRQD